MNLTCEKVERLNPDQRPKKSWKRYFTLLLYVHCSDTVLLVECGGEVAPWLVRSTPERVVWVQALAGDIVLCSWARHLTLTVPLSTQEYKWVPANCWENLTNCWGKTGDRLSSRPGEVEILLSSSHYTETGIRSASYEPVGSKASLFYISC